MRGVLWLGFFFNIVSVTAAPVSLLEGDIVITPRIAKLMLSGRKRSAIKEDVLRWKDGIIPYTISEDLEKYASLFSDAFKVFHESTCLRFVRATPQHNDYIKFVKNNGCFSAIGRQGAMQEVSIGDGCFSLKHVLHEIMHSIGFFHEQSRYDRALYVKILWWNIADEALKNFAQYEHGSIDTLDAPYDKHSILHYARNAFSKNGRHTIEALHNPTEVLGGDTLSEIDLYQVNKLYTCKKEK